MGLVRDFLNAFNNGSALLLVRSRTQPGKATEVSDDEPLPVRVIGGSTGGGSDAGSARETTLAQVRDGHRCLGTYPAEQINVGAERGLTVPAGATDALVTVYAGQIQAGLGDTVNAPTLGPGEFYELSGAQLAAFRLVHAGNVDSLVRVDYWRMGQVLP